MAATDLFDLAEEFLDACVAAIATESLGGPIGYAAVSTGLPAFDCVPAIFVHAGGPSMADTLPLNPSMQPMERVGVQGFVNLITMTCTVLRCVPVTEQTGQTVILPSADSITDAAKVTYADLWAIWNYCRTQYRAGLLFPSPSGRREFIYDPAVPVKTSGGAGGWEIQVRVQLGGYKTGVV